MKTSRKHIVWPSETEEQLGIGQVDSVTGEKKKQRIWSFIVDVDCKSEWDTGTNKRNNATLVNNQPK